MAESFAAGRFRHRVTIEEPNEVQDPVSGAVEIVSDTSHPTGWVAVFENVPAEVEALSGREYLAAAQLQSEQTHTITLRWRDGLHAKQRIVWAPAGAQTRYFNILAVIAGGYGQREYVEIRCSEGLNDGGRDTYAG